MESSKAGALRDGLQGSKDPRADRTRQAVADAVREIAASPSRGRSITIAEIARVSGVSRSSFYAHFANLEEVAGFILREDFARVADAYLVERRDMRIGPREALHRAVILVVDQYVENRDFFAGLAVDGRTDQVRVGLARYLAGEIVGTLQHFDAVTPGLRMEVAASYIANGVTGLLSAWLVGDFIATPEELVEHLLALLPAWLGAPEQA